MKSCKVHGQLQPNASPGWSPELNTEEVSIVKEVNVVEYQIEGVLTTHD